jgi:hypothetical protein
MRNIQIKSFSEYLREDTKEIVVTFARFNPPTIAHEKLIDKVASMAKGNNYKIFVLSPQEDTHTSNISSLEKIKLMRKMFPKYGRAIMNDPDIHSISDIISQLKVQGYSKVTIVIDAQNIPKLELLIPIYNLMIVNILPSGLSDPDNMVRKHIKLDMVSEERENYVKGLLYNLHDNVIIKENKETAKITMLGSNYVIIETKDGAKHRKWLSDINII